MKSDKELSEDALHQTKASHDASMSILQTNHRKQVKDDSVKAVSS